MEPINSKTLKQPLPTTFISKGQRIGGEIKQRPADFIVEELPLYEPEGYGEHLYLRVQKENLSHGDLVRIVAKHFDISEKRIGFAGMKDKHAITTQTISLHTPKNYDVDLPIHENIRVAWSDRHVNKLRRGHLLGNRFAIRIRNVDPLHTPIVSRRLEELAETGVPNFFGPQRFGYRANNHVMGVLALQRDWQQFLIELLGISGSEFPEYQTQRRKMFMQGRYRDAWQEWSKSDRAERAALQSLQRDGNERRAALSIGRRAMSFYICALQSAVFNDLLAQRIADDTLQMLEPGDLAWKHDSRSVFAVDEELAKSDMTTLRLRDFEISPSGPLWGAGMTRTAGRVVERELAALNSFRAELDEFDQLVCKADGSRRPMRIQISNVSTEGGIDEHGGYIRVAFELSRGSYATVVLREIMGE